jgi:hypothetical protein
MMTTETIGREMATTVIRHGELLELTLVPEELGA